MNPPAYSTTAGRAVLGLLAAMLVGGVLSAGIELFSADEARDAEALARNALSVGLGGVVIVALLLVFPTLPVWALCHRLGYRSWRTATPLGGLVGGGAMAILMTFSDRPQETSGLVIVFVIFGLIGAIVGFVAWRIAYRRALERPEDVF